MSTLSTPISRDERSGSRHFSVSSVRRIKGDECTSCEIFQVIWKFLSFHPTTVSNVKGSE